MIPSEQRFGRAEIRGQQVFSAAFILQPRRFFFNKKRVFRQKQQEALMLSKLPALLTLFVIARSPAWYRSRSRSLFRGN